MSYDRRMTPEQWQWLQQVAGSGLAAYLRERSMQSAARGAAQEAIRRLPVKWATLGNVTIELMDAQPPTTPSAPTIKDVEFTVRKDEDT